MGYAHFPINCNMGDEGKKIEIRNFLGEKFVRKVNMREGVCVSASAKQKDELILEGNDIEQVSLSAALIQQSTTVKRKAFLLTVVDCWMRAAERDTCSMSLPSKMSSSFCLAEAETQTPSLMFTFLTNFSPKKFLISIFFPSSVMLPMMGK